VFACSEYAADRLAPAARWHEVSSDSRGQVWSNDGGSGPSRCSSEPTEHPRTGIAAAKRPSALGEREASKQAAPPPLARLEVSHRNVKMTYQRAQQ